MLVPDGIRPSPSAVNVRIRNPLVAVNVRIRNPPVAVNVRIRNCGNGNYKSC